MAKDKDDLADALAALAAGEHVEPDDGDTHGQGVELESHAAPPAPSRSAAPKQAPPKPVSGLRPGIPQKPTTATAVPQRAAAPTPVARAGASAVPPQARPAIPTTSTTAGAPTAKARPANPDPPARSTAPRAPGIPPARPQAPNAPMPSAPPPPQEAFVNNAPEVESEMVSDIPHDEPAPSEGEDWIGPAPEDDDAMLAPAPDREFLAAHTLSYKPPVVRKAQGPGVKQTMVPILLTSGVLLIIFGLLKFVLGPDSPYSGLQGWVVGMVMAMGALLVGLGVFTALQVKEQLARQAAATKRQAS